MNVLNLSLGDLSDEENIKTAQYELGRLPAIDWAAKWGEALIARCFETAGEDDEDEDALTKAEDEATKAEEKIAEISDAVEAFIKLLDKEFPSQSQTLMNAIGALEGVL